MARLPRYVLPEAAVYHVTGRGVAGEAIYRDDADRSRFARLQRRAEKRWHWHVLASCQMTNHFHIVVVGELDNVSRGMHLLNFRYAQGFNERHDRRGHLYQDRFHSKVIRNDEHLVRACEYVLDNPVRAGLLPHGGTGPGLVASSSTTYAEAWTGDNAGAHEHSGDDSPSRPFRRRYPSACSACIILWICVVPS
jgi:putative transposase